NDLARMRTDYPAVAAHDVAADPFTLFDRWLDDAVAADVPEPNAMALATASSHAEPAVRIVLLKGLDRQGAVFYTNYQSSKGLDLEENPRASAVMLWHPVHRQVRFAGPVTRLSGGESDAYFASRPRVA